MCNQAVGLIAAELERQGISTVAIQLLRSVAKKVRPPRALFVPYKHGYPLGEPNAAEQQHEVIEAALKLLEIESAQSPMLVDFEDNLCR